MLPALIRHLGIVPYMPTYRAMQQFTDTRQPETTDEIWILQHPPVYTLGLAGRWEHLHRPGDILVYPTDRGGQVTYHGPGQLIVYILLDLKRRHFAVKRLVYLLEQAVIDYLSHQQIVGERRDKAPGVYVQGRKLAALGLRVRHGCSYHGLSLNVAMDLTPFQGINPCGYAGLEVTQLRDLGVMDDFHQVTTQFLACLFKQLDMPAIAQEI